MDTSLSSKSAPRELLNSKDYSQREKTIRLWQVHRTSFDEWTKSAQEKETSLTAVLDAGRWNNVELILAPATTEQLGVVDSVDEH